MARDDPNVRGHATPGIVLEPEGIALVGYRGSGKSTVGRIIADRLGWAFADADEVLERRVGRSIASIFAEWGEPRFRDEERATIAGT